MRNTDWSPNVDQHIHRYSYPLVCAWIGAWLVSVSSMIWLETRLQQLSTSPDRNSQVFLLLDHCFNVFLWGIITKDIHNDFVRWRILCLRWSTQLFKLQSVFSTLLIFLWTSQWNRGFNHTDITSIGSFVTFSRVSFHLVESLLGYWTMMNFRSNVSQRCSACWKQTKQIWKDLDLNFPSTGLRILDIVSSKRYCNKKNGWLVWKSSMYLFWFVVTQQPIW